MVKRRIKRNFEEQLSAVSSFMTHIPQNRTKDETKPNKKRTWHRIRVWRKEDPQTRVVGEPRVNNPHERPIKVKIDSKPNKKRTWHCNRVRRKVDPQTQVGGDPRVKDIPDRPTKVNVNNQLQNDEKLVKEPHRKHSDKPACISTSFVHPAPSADVVAPHSRVKATSLSNTDPAKAIASSISTTPTTASISTTAPTTASIITVTPTTASISTTTPNTVSICTTTPSTASALKSVTRQFVAPPSKATVSKTETSTISVLSETTSPVLCRGQLIRPIRLFRVMVKLRHSMKVLLVMTRWHLSQPPFALLPLKRRRELALSTHSDLLIRQRSKWIGSLQRGRDRRHAMFQKTCLLETVCRRHSAELSLAVVRRDTDGTALFGF